MVPKLFHEIHCIYNVHIQYIYIYMIYFFVLFYHYFFGFPTVMSYKEDEEKKSCSLLVCLKVFKTSTS